MDHLGRAVLLINGVLFVKMGAEYLRGSLSGDGISPTSLPTIAKLPNSEFRLGVGMIIPFTGCAYLAVGSTNLLAAALFGNKEAGVTLGLTGLWCHLAMAVARLQLPRDVTEVYTPGAISKVNKTQFGLGALSLGCSATLLLG
ncbi:hypothetical protein T484DRAFT_1966627 [Baffinella frigidus]|nr:hypothetical protein T484DRAFT_1966627 [Cryptophyta sp. CCMP2293]